MNMKTKICLLSVMLVSSLVMFAQKVKMGGVTYQIKDDHAIIYDVDKSASTITIEGAVEYKGQRYMVTEVRMEGAWSIISKSRLLKHASFSETCTEILPDVLKGVKVVSITLPNTIKRIGDRAFSFSKLQTIFIPNSVLEIGSDVFNNSPVESVILPNRIQRIGKRTFSSSYFLKEIVIPPSVQEIGEDAFLNCKDLKNIILPEGIYFEDHPFGYIDKFSKNWKGEYWNHYCNNITNVQYHNGKVATDLINILPPDCPFVKNGGKLQNSDFAKRLLAKYNAAQGGTMNENDKAAEPILLPSELAIESIDKDIPVANKLQLNTFVLIIANEDYTKESKVPFALNDGKIVERYFCQTLGIPQKNIHKIENATLNNMKYEIDWLRQVLMAYKGEASAIVYYAGHGIPDESTKTAYLLPVDGYGSNVMTGYSLKDLYKELSEQPSQSVIVFLDACFSGANRDGKMLASARGVRIKVKETIPQGKLIIFSAAQEDQTAYPFNEQRHGMFTYYLLKKMKDTKGDVTLGDLTEYVTSEVMRQSIVTNGKMQTPKVITSISDDWKSKKLK